MLTASNYHLPFSPSPSLLLFQSQSHSQVVDTASGALVVDLQAHEGALWSLAVRPDGKGFVTASADKEVKFWDFTVSPANYTTLPDRAHHHGMAAKHVVHVQSGVLNFLPRSLISPLLHFRLALTHYFISITITITITIADTCRWRREEYLE